MQFLLIVAKTTYGLSQAYNGELFDKDQNPNAFNYIESSTQNLETIVYDRDNNTITMNDNIARITADNIEDIEPIMRLIGFRRCDICGNWVTPQDIRARISIYDGSKRYCKSCLKAKDYYRSTRQTIKRYIRLCGYHCTSENVRVINGIGENFTLSNVLGIGIEMELNNRNLRIIKEYEDVENQLLDEENCNSSYLESTEAFWEISNANSSNRIFRVEEDGTVQAEIISNVFTKKALYAFDWNILTDVLRLNKNDESCRAVGFHVHCSNLWLGNDEREQALNFLKLQYFLKSYAYDFKKLSGRADNDTNWCAFYTDEQIDLFKTRITNGYAMGSFPSDHSYALIRSRNTIELRIGHSTNDPKKIEHYLKLVLGIVENIKNVPFSKCYCLRKVTKLVPAETMAYWRKQGCFLNTNAVDNRGVSL